MQRVLQNIRVPECARHPLPESLERPAVQVRGVRPLFLLLRQHEAAPADAQDPRPADGRLRRTDQDELNGGARDEHAAQEHRADDEPARRRQSADAQVRSGAAETGVDEDTAGD